MSVILFPAERLSRAFQPVPETPSLFVGQAVRCEDPDLKGHPAGPVLTEGTVAGFDEDRGDVLVKLIGETRAARRLKPDQIQPRATP